MLLWPQDRLLRAGQGFDQICAVLEVGDTLRACGCAASLCSKQMVCVTTVDMTLPDAVSLQVSPGLTTFSSSFGPEILGNRSACESSQLSQGTTTCSACTGSK